MRAELAHAGEGEYLTVVFDEADAVVEEIWTSGKAEALAAIAKRWPGIPIKWKAVVKENPAQRRRKEAQ